MKPLDRVRLLGLALVAVALLYDCNAEAAGLTDAQLMSIYKQCLANGYKDGDAAVKCGQRRIAEYYADLEQKIQANADAKVRELERRRPPPTMHCMPGGSGTFNCFPM